MNESSASGTERKKITCFEDLFIWQKGIELAREIYLLTVDSNAGHARSILIFSILRKVRQARSEASWLLHLRSAILKRLN